MNAKTEVQKSIHIINSVKVTLIRLGFLLPLIKLGGTLHPPLNNSGYIHAIDVKFDIPGQLLTLYKKLILYFFARAIILGVMGDVNILGPTRAQKPIIVQNSRRDF